MKVGLFNKVPWSLLLIGGLGLYMAYKTKQATDDVRALRTLVETKINMLEANLASFTTVLKKGWLT